MKTLARLKRENLDLSAIPKLNLFSWRDLEHRLGYTHEYLCELAAKAGAHYDPFIKAPKQHWFQKDTPNPKKRIIDNPNPKLRNVQKRIYRRLLRNTVLPFFICGGVKGRTLLDNFYLHSGTSVLVTVDIASFFPSVTNEQVYFIWKEVLNCSTDIAILLTRLTTFERHLPQGAATSTPLANILICTIYRKIRLECERIGIKYSTWVDDLAFSGLNARGIIPVVINTLNRAGLRVSRRKIHVMGAGSRKLLNGIIVGKYPGILRENLSRIRSGIHKLVSGQVPMHDHAAYLRSLCARIRQAEMINPRQAKRFREKLVSALKQSGISKKLKQKYLRQLDHSQPKAIANSNMSEISAGTWPPESNPPSNCSNGSGL